MDDKGNLYLEVDEKLYKEVKQKPKKLHALSPEDYAKVKGMNRAERRQWLRENKRGK